LSPVDESELRRRAEKRVDARAGFYRHALIFAVVSLGLLAINLIFYPHFFFFLFPFFGWGVGLWGHGASVFGRRDQARERAVQDEMDRLRGS
jgi:hypothetical protein